MFERFFPDAIQESTYEIDFEALQSEINALRSELEELKAKPKAKTVKKAVEEVTDGE